MKGKNSDNTTHTQKETKRNKKKRKNPVISRYILDSTEAWKISFWRLMIISRHVVCPIDLPV